MGSVPVPVPAPYLYHKKQIFLKNMFPFYIVSCFTREKIININKFIVKCEEKKMLNEVNQIHNFISSSGSDFLMSCGSSSGSTRQKVTVPTVPVQQHCWNAGIPNREGGKTLET
jgi:hypothetical protein